MNKNYVIALGREFCSGGREIGKMIAERLGINYYDKEELRKKAKELGVDEGVFEMFDEQPTRSFLFSIAMDPYSLDNALNSGKVIEAQRKTIISAAEQGPCVIVGRRADKILQELEDVEVVSVFIGADIEYRIKRFIESGQASDGKNIRRMIERRDRERASYYNYLGDGQWGKANNYTMCFSTDKISKEKICDIVCAYVNTL